MSDYNGNGRFYPWTFLQGRSSNSGKVEVKYMTQEEDILTSQKFNTGRYRNRHIQIIDSR